MTLPSGTEFAWFLSGMWAAIFILRAGRSTHAGFFAVLALLVVAVLPAVALLYESQLAEIGKRIQDALR